MFVQGKLRIREIISNESTYRTLSNIHRASQICINPMLLNPQLGSDKNKKIDSDIRTNQPMLQFDFNQNPITLKCRLYIIKALLFRAWDSSGKTDPYIKILLNREVIIDDVNSRLYNTLEPIFGK